MAGFKYLAAALGVAAVGFAVTAYILNLKLDAAHSALRAANEKIAGLELVITRQNDHIAELGRQAAEKAKEVLSITKPATKARVRAQNNVTIFLDYQPVGSTLEERVLEVDAQVLKELKK